MARFDGKKNKQVCTSLKLSELSGVTTPAHTGANVTLFKCDTQSLLKSAAGAIFANALTEARATEDVRRRLEPLFEAKYEADRALYDSNDDAMELGDAERVKQNMRDYALTLLAAAGVISDNGDTTKMATEYAYENEGVNKLPIDTKENVNGAAQALSPEGYRGNQVEGIPDNMMRGVRAKVRAAWKKFYPDKPDSEMPESIRKSGADDMTDKELATLKALAEMNDVQKSHYQTLTTDDARDEFVKASATERDGIVETVKSADESYTMTTGVVIKKSTVGDSFELLKSSDERLAKMEQEQSIAKYSAVAETTLKSMPGETIAKAAVLAEIEKMSPAVQTTLNAMLKAGETELAKALDDSTVHVVHGQSIAKGSAHEQIEALVKSYQADNKVNYSKAYSAVMDTPEAQKLYEQMGA